MLPYWTAHPASTLVSGDEILMCSQNGVGIYDKEVKSPYQNGKLSLSTHKLFFEDEEHKGIISLDLSLLKPTLGRYAGIGWSHPKITCAFNNGFYLKFSFRQGGFDSFANSLTEVLAKKHWEKPKPVVAAVVSDTVTRSDPASAAAVSTPQQDSDPFAFTDRAGISGVLRQQPQSSDSNLADVLNDINTVMSNAGALISAIKKFKSQTGMSNEDATAIISIEEALGLGTVVTASSIGTGGKFHKELAIEIGKWIAVDANPLSKSPVIPLVELYSRYNKARGRELVSPQDLVDACKLMNGLPSSKLSLRTFRSGVMALVNESVGTVEAVLEKVLGPMPAPKSVPAPGATIKWIMDAQFAALLNSTESIAGEILEDLESDEVLCRSESHFGEKTFYWNVFAF